LCLQPNIPPNKKKKIEPSPKKTKITHPDLRIPVRPTTPDASPPGASPSTHPERAMSFPSVPRPLVRSLWRAGGEYGYGGRNSTGVWGAVGKQFVKLPTHEDADDEVCFFSPHHPRLSCAWSSCAEALLNTLTSSNWDSDEKEKLEEILQAALVKYKTAARTHIFLVFLLFLVLLPPLLQIFSLPCVHMRSLGSSHICLCWHPKSPHLPLQPNWKKKKPIIRCFALSLEENSTNRVARGK
jgi:hypothetical protein